MIKLKLKSGSDAAKKALKTGNWAALDAIEERNRATVTELYHRIKAGSIKGIYLQSDNTFIAIHRSTKSQDCLQISRGYYNDGELVPLSDYQAETPEEIQERMQKGIYKIIE